MDGTSSTMATATGSVPTITTSHSTFAFTPPTLQPTPSAESDGMAGMDQMAGMAMAPDIGTCKVSMLWNWETIDACFLSESWQIKSRGGFAGLCIGVILLAILLEMLRRTAKTYDRHLIRQRQKTVTFATTASNNAPETADGSLIAKCDHAAIPTAAFRPNIPQQIVRALLHTLQFALAYWMMLLAMYYNGYIIICMIIGAFIGSFIFQWERIGPRNDSGTGGAATHDATGCCG